MREDDPLVYVIDDDASIREALGALLRSVGLRTEAFALPREFLAFKRSDAPCCMVLDVRLPGSSGLEFQRELTAMNANIPIIFITGHGDIPMAVEAMQHGAFDFLQKPFRDQDLLDAVTAAIERDRLRREADGDAALMRESFLTLSPREQQVMMLVTAGRMNKQVAADLGLSEITVKIHRGAAMRKMGARTLADLVRMADGLKPTSPGETAGGHSDRLESLKAWRVRNTA